MRFFIRRLMCLLLLFCLFASPAMGEAVITIVDPDGEEVSLTLSIYDGDGNKKFSCPVPFEGEDMNIVAELLAVDEGAFGYEVRIVEGSGAGSRIRTVKVTFDAVMGLIK